MITASRLGGRKFLEKGGMYIGVQDDLIGNGIESKLDLAPENLASEIKVVTTGSGTGSHRGVSMRRV